MNGSVLCTMGNNGGSCGYPANRAALALSDSNRLLLAKPRAPPNAAPRGPPLRPPRSPGPCDVQPQHLTFHLFECLGNIQDGIEITGRASQLSGLATSVVILRHFSLTELILVLCHIGRGSKASSGPSPRYARRPSPVARQRDLSRDFLDDLISSFNNFGKSMFSSWYRRVQLVAFPLPSTSHRVV